MPRQLCRPCVLYSVPRYPHVNKERKEGEMMLLPNLVRRCRELVYHCASEGVCIRIRMKKRYLLIRKCMSCCHGDGWALSTQRRRQGSFHLPARARPTSLSTCSIRPSRERPFRSTLWLHLLVQRIQHVAVCTRSTALIVLILSWT